MDKEKFKDPGIWSLLKDGEVAMDLSGRVGVERRGDRIVSLENRYEIVGRMDGRYAMSWGGSQTLAKTDGRYSYTLSGQTLYKRMRDGEDDVIMDLSDNIIARVRRIK